MPRTPATDNRAADWPDTLPVHRPADLAGYGAGTLVSQCDIWSRHSIGELQYRFATMDNAERAGLYQPNRSDFCSACGVRTACPDFMGSPS